MRLQKTIFTSFMAAATLLFSACGSMAVSGTPASQNTQPSVYRGSVVDTKEDGSIEVAQQPGFNYGYESIVFHIDETTYIDLENGATPNKDAFVEIHYSGALTRSIPPQGTALDITVIAPFTEGVIQNGVIREVRKTDDGFSIDLLPFSAESDAPESLVVLNVPADALENLSAEALVSGAEVSAVTRGIATMSLPPQMPVLALAPYSP